eukprot:1148362-Pelagomonas_calceolata.AAC.2
MKEKRANQGLKRCSFLPSREKRKDRVQLGSDLGGKEQERSVAKVRLHRYICLQLVGQLSRSTEACNQTWPKNARLAKLGKER